MSLYLLPVYSNTSLTWQQCVDQRLLKYLEEFPITPFCYQLVLLLAMYLIFIQKNTKLFKRGPCHGLEVCLNLT